EAESPTVGVGGFANSQAVAELVKLGAITRIGAMQVFSLGDQFKLVVSRNALVFQHAGKRGQVGCIDDQELVLVELDLHGAQGGQSCQAGAAVVQEEILEIAAIAFQDRQVDVLAKQVAVIGVTRRGAVGVV